VVSLPQGGPSDCLPQIGPSMLEQSHPRCCSTAIAFQISGGCNTLFLLFGNTASKVCDGYPSPPNIFCLIPNTWHSAEIGASGWTERQKHEGYEDTRRARRAGHTMLQAVCTSCQSRSHETHLDALSFFVRFRMVPSITGDDAMG
jgi:hypothetical protein